MSSDSNHDPGHYGRKGQFERAGICHWTCPVEWNRHFRERASSGVEEIRGRLRMEVWADEPLASAKRIGRELGPWTETQRARREKRALAGSRQVLVPRTLDRDLPK